MTPADFIETNPQKHAPRAAEPHSSPDIPALTALTGRDTEVSLLTDRWEQAQEGMGQVVLLVGEAGVGKSRLVQTIRQRVLAEVGHAANGAPGASPVIEWRCSSRTQSTGLFPITDHLQRLFEFDGEESSSTRFDRIAQYLDDCGLGRPEIVALFARMLFLPPDERYPVPGLTPVREREETFRAVREWLRACSSRQPVLFIIEDLHWIDASSMEFLEQFIAEGLHDRILTVMTFRPEFRTPWPAMAHQTSLALNCLTRRHVAELMRKDAGKPVPDSLVTQIYQRTRGVPLLVEEFTRLIRDSTGEASGGNRRGPETALAHGGHDIPATLQELLLSRLDGMASNRDLAQLAATLGREVEYELLAAVAPMDERTLQAELAKLVNADILRAMGQPPRCAYVFKHALLEEALHNALEDEQRRSFHRHVAEVMETRFPQSAENRPELLAWHFSEAGLIEKATAYWLKAGLRARDQFANIEAIDHLTRGLKLLEAVEVAPWREGRELELLTPLGTAYIAAHGYAAPHVSPVFQRARVLCERVGTTTQLFAVMRGNFAFHVVRGNYRHCAELADEALTFGEQRNDPGIIMEALFLKGLAMLYRGDFRGARDCFTRALADYDDRERTAFWATMTGEDSGVTHRCYLALAWWHLGCADRAVQMSREARELARATGKPFNIEYALHHTGWLCQHCRLGVEAQAAGEEEVAIAREQGFPLWQATGTLYAAAGLVLQGKVEAGLPLLQQGLEAYRATGAGLAAPYYLSLLGDALMRANRFDEARRAFDEALDLAEKNDERFQEAELHRLKGELHLAASGDQAGAEACFRRAIEIAQQQGSLAWELRATMSLARLWQMQRRRDKALARLSAIFGAFNEGLATPDLINAAALLSELGHERLRMDLDAGVKYIRDCIPAPCQGRVSVDWRYIPSSTVGGDTIGYHWLDEDHLALYLIDVTGHGLDSALLSVTINNVIRTASLPGTDMKNPEQVLARLNETFSSRHHGHKFFTAWFGIYAAASRTLTYAAGGHPSAIVVVSGNPAPLELPATGPPMGVLPSAKFPASSFPMEAGARLLIFSDGAYEILRKRQVVWNLTECVAYLAELGQRDGNLMDELLAKARELRGSFQLDDDFSVIEARFH